MKLGCAKFEIQKVQECQASVIRMEMISTSLSLSLLVEHHRHHLCHFQVWRIISFEENFYLQTIYSHLMLTILQWMHLVEVIQVQVRVE